MYVHMNSRLQFTCPLKKIKISQKKGIKPKKEFARLSRYNGPTFYEKKISLHNPIKFRAWTLIPLISEYICIYNFIFFAW